jgi:hypothetical protein
MAVSGGSILSAQDYGRWDAHRDSRDVRRDYRHIGNDYADSRDVRQDYRHIGNDYANLEAMRSHIAQDRARMNEDIRCGREQAAAHDAADLARDQRALNDQSRDIQRDRSNLRYERGYR